MIQLGIWNKNAPEWLYRIFFYFFLYFLFYEASLYYSTIDFYLLGNIFMSVVK